MDKVEQFFRNMSDSNEDHNRLVNQVKDVLFGQKPIHILYGSGFNGKTSLVNIINSILERKMYTLPYDSICSEELDPSYVPYVMDKEYIIVEDQNDIAVQPTILKKLTTGYTCQYRKPYTSNWNQITISPKRLIIITNINPDNTPFVTNEELSKMTNIIKFDVHIKNPDFNLVKDISNNHHNDVYNYLANY